MKLQLWMFWWFGKINLITQLNVTQFLILQGFSTWKVSLLLWDWWLYPDSCWWCHKTQPTAKKKTFSSREVIKITKINQFNSHRIPECRERSLWSQKRWPHPCHGPASDSPSGGRDSVIKLIWFSWNDSHFLYISWWFLKTRGQWAQRLTTWVSLEALATASPLSVKYLNSWDRKCDQTSPDL